MSLPVLATSEQVEAARAWIKAHYTHYDSSDIQGWLTKFLLPDVVVTLANQPSLNGHKELLDHVTNERAHLSSIKHEIKHTDVYSDRIYVQNQGIFIVKNDPDKKEIIIKAVAVFWKKVNEDKASSIEVYFDPSPLMERLKTYP